MTPLELVKLNLLMERTAGRPEVKIGLIDGPVLISHPDLAGRSVHEVPGKVEGTCSRASSVACVHGTFVAGMLMAKADSTTPGICPGCTLLVRAIFTENGSVEGRVPSATPEELATAIVETVNAGARVLNLSSAVVDPSAKGKRDIEEALNFAAHRGVISVAAAGNQGTVGSSVITRHTWIIPVAACDLRGRPTDETNLGNSIGRRGLSAPGKGVSSLVSDGRSRSLGGTSAAAPFVTGAVALLWSEFPQASAAQMKIALTQADRRRHGTIIPPVLDAWAAHQRLAAMTGRS
jgi:subtilisin family serine protease